MGIKRVKRKVNGKLEYVYVYDFRLRGRRVRTPRSSYFPTRDECEDAVSTIKADFRRGVYQFPTDAPRITIKAAADSYIESLELADRHPRHIQRGRNVFTYLSEIIALDKPIVDLTEKHLEKYLALRLKTVKRQTVFGDFMHLMNCFKRAKKDFKSELRAWQIPDKPASVKKIRIGRTRIITHDEEARILAELRRPLEGREARHSRARLDTADIFELALKTAMRIGEVMRLKWSDAQLERAPGYENGWLVVRATKTAERGTGREDERIVPLTPAANALLKRRQTVSESAYVFPAVGSRGTATGHRAMIHWSLKRAAVVAEVLYGKFTEGGFVFHDTRHTAITRMLQGGADIRTVMDIAGHKDISTTLAYTHSTARSKSAAVLALDSPVRSESVQTAKQSQTDQSSPTEAKAQAASKE